ncbi:hypothetical protein Dimus_011609 [Dionaea muscipula]
MLKSHGDGIGGSREQTKKQTSSSGSNTMRIHMKQSAVTLYLHVPTTTILLLFFHCCILLSSASSSSSPTPNTTSNSVDFGEINSTRRTTVLGTVVASGSSVAAKTRTGHGGGEGGGARGGRAPGVSGGDSGGRTPDASQTAGRRPSGAGNLHPQHRGDGASSHPCPSSRLLGMTLVLLVTLVLQQQSS